MPVPVRMEGDFHEVGIVKGGSRSVEGLVRILPPWRPRFPKVVDYISSILLQPHASLLSIEVPLIPPFRFIGSSSRMLSQHRILHRVTADGHESFDHMRLQDSRDTGGAIAPIKARDRKFADPQGFRKVDKVLTNRRLLGHARGV